MRPYQHQPAQRPLMEGQLRKRQAGRRAGFAGPSLTPTMVVSSVGIGLSRPARYRRTVAEPGTTRIVAHDLPFDAPPLVLADATGRPAHRQRQSDGHARAQRARAAGLFSAGISDPGRRGLSFLARVHRLAYHDRPARDDGRGDLLVLSN